MAVCAAAANQEVRMGIKRLGHVGIHVNDLGRVADFYEHVVGLTVTDRDPNAGMVFLSSRPAEEHHELLLCGGRNVPVGTLMLHQISFACDSLEDVFDYYGRFREHAVPIDMIVTHGNAIGIYFLDPEGNRCEVYWQTGLAARQPFLEHIDLNQSPDQIMALVGDLVERYGATGHVDHGAMLAQNLVEGAR
jgi:catechol-2,3-dioxygenase